MSGVDRVLPPKTLAEARENRHKGEECVKHMFAPSDPHSLAEARVICSHCGAMFAWTEARMYAQGFEAAGGNPNEVWPGYRSRAAKAGIGMRSPLTIRQLFQQVG